MWQGRSLGASSEKPVEAARNICFCERVLNKKTIAAYREHSQSLRNIAVLVMLLVLSRRL